MRKKTNINSRISIGTKLLAILLASLVVTVAVTFIISTNRYNTFIDQENQAQAGVALQNLSDQIANISNLSAQNTATLANDTAIQQALEQKDTTTLKSILASKNEFLRLDFISVMDKSGGVLAGINDQVNSEVSIAGQEGFKKALNGETTTGIDNHIQSLFLYRTDTPMKNKQGEIIGTIASGYTLERNELLDGLKKNHGIDFTIFAGDVRLATTIKNGEKRVVGTKLDPKIADIVLKNKQKYFGQAAILGTPYLTAYTPLLDKDNNALGVLFAGKPVSDVRDEENSILMTSLLIGAALLVAVALLAALYIRKGISNPMLRLADNAQKISIGDTELNLSAKSNRGKGKNEKGKKAVRNELQILSDAFKQIVTNTKKQSEIAMEIANGNTDVELEARSEKDTLCISMMNMVETLKNLTAELNELTAAAKEGNFVMRGDTSRYSGDYAMVVGGVNEILDEMEKSLSQVQGARATIEKKSRYQSAEIEKLVSTLEKLAQGELICDFTVSPSDEDTMELYDLFETVRNNLYNTVSSIKGYIQEISLILGDMASGKLDKEITTEFEGDFSELKTSINSIAQSLNTVLHEINTAANQVAAGTKQVSEGSQALSQGATEQASSIEELTSSITEIAAQTRQNAANAAEANQLAVTASSAAAKGNAQMAGMLRSMEDINESSNSISKIIKVIDDIAFQTNILALNAAVEAARAGIHGKGFAVVAEEVRNLAAKSAEAAKETTAMIESSIKKVEEGSRIANDTATALNEILSSVEKAATLVGEIAVASNQQATGIAQVNKGIEQVAAVVQNNSATAQESAATTEELSGQAEMLKSMVGRFQLKGYNSEAPAAIKETGKKTEKAILPAGAGGGYGKY